MGDPPVALARRLFSLDATHPGPQSSYYLPFEDLLFSSCLDGLFVFNLNLLQDRPSSSLSGHPGANGATN